MNDSVEKYSPARAASVALGHDTNTRELTKFLELTLKPGLIHVPGEVSNEEVGRCTGSRLLSLGLLGSGRDILLSLTLLGVLGRLFAVLRLRLRRVIVTGIGRLLKL